MKNKTALHTPDSPSVAQKNMQEIFFVLLALISGVGIAYAVRSFGPLVLLGIPVLLIVSSISGQPDFGLATVVFMLLTQTTQVLRIHHGLPSPAQPLLVLLLVVIIVRMILYSERPLGWKRIAPIFIALTVSLMISVINAKDFDLAVNDFINIMTNIVVVIIMVYFIRTPASFRRIVWTLLAAGIFMGTISVFQNFTNTFGNLYGGFGGWELDFSSGSGRHRLTGPFANPNAYAQVMIVIVPLALDRLWHERDKFLRILAGWAVIVSVLSIALTYSRNGFLTLVFTLGFLVMMTRPSVAPLIITVALGIGLLNFLPASYLDRIGSLLQFSSVSSEQISDGSFRGRVSENTAAWMMFRDNPIFGIGLNNFPVYYQDYSRQIGLDVRRETREPASFYLELLSEGGLVGTSLFLYMVIWVFKGLIRAKTQLESLRMFQEMHIVTALIVGLGGYMFFYISKNSAYSNVFWVLIGLALSITQVVAMSPSTGRDPVDPSLELIS